MEAAIRWSPHSDPDHQQFLIVDVHNTKLQLCQIEELSTKGVTYRKIAKRDNDAKRDNKLPNFTAFDWSKTQPYLVALGAQSGEANLVRIDPEKTMQDEPIVTLGMRYPRKCNSIAFSNKDLLATGLDRVRHDHCLNIYDVNNVNVNISATGASAGTGTNTHTKPYRQLATGEPITSIKFFAGAPDTLVCGVRGQCIRLFDLRDPQPTAQLPTRSVHNLAIDPLDENYFISAGPPGEPIVTIWDRRMIPKTSPSTPSSSEQPGPSGPVLELRPAVENTNSNSNIWALRYSGTKRGCFGVLSSTGEVRVVETSSHSAKVSGLTAMPVNQYGGTPWSGSSGSSSSINVNTNSHVPPPTRNYVKRTHHLTYPWYDSENGRGEASRVIGYDFVSRGILPNDVGILALKPSRDVELMKVPDVARKLTFTAWDELYTDNYLKQPSRPKPAGKVAAELVTLQEQALNSEAMLRSTGDLQASTQSQLSKLNMENFGHKAPLATSNSSVDEHERLLSLSFPSYIPPPGDALNLLRVQRRRCMEGYQLDPHRNKGIVSNDPWLVDMWDTISRFQEMSTSHGGMIANGLDLSYLGVFAILNNSLGTSRNRDFSSSDTLDTNGRSNINASISHDRFVNAVTSIVHAKGYPGFLGHKTKYAAHRQLCLALCDWTFSKDLLRTYCQRLMSRGEIYKAVVLAVLRGFRDLAQELLRVAIQSKSLSNIGLGAVIACESVNKEQRELCEWMVEETEDPYLKALLRYFIEGDWKVVAEMETLSLRDRVGVALKYLDDRRLEEFVRARTREAIQRGDLEGLVLTGLGDQKAMDLFSVYVKKFGDLQTAVLATSFSAPLYVEDGRFGLWKETYLMQMQTWRAFNERTKYLEAHANMSKGYDGRLWGSVPERPATLRCAHCHSPLATRTLTNNDDETGSVSTTLAPKPRPTHPNHHNNSNGNDLVVAKNGAKCLHCNRRTPICGICGLQLASPDARRLGAGAAKKLAEEDAIARQVVRCGTCGHGFHGHHARDWFARRGTCPIVGCGCGCAGLH